MPHADEATAIAIDRSTTGSLIRTPPTVATYTSWSLSRIPTRLPSTASTIATRLDSSPEVVRRGCGAFDGPTSACTSASSGRRPSIMTVTQVPGTGSVCRDTNSPVGSVTSTMPVSTRSKQPTSSAGPNLFLVARTIRKPECRSPSNASTTSTRCSSIRGPAMAPSLVT